MPMQGYFLAGGAGIVVAFIAAVVMIRPFRTWCAARAQEKRLKELDLLETKIWSISSVIDDREALVRYLDLALTREGPCTLPKTPRDKERHEQMFQEIQEMKTYLCKLEMLRKDLIAEIRAHQPSQQ